MATTLLDSPIAPLLDRLFSQADETTSPEISAMSSDEREALVRSKTAYIDLYGRLKDLWLPVSRETGTLLYILARGMNAKNVLEFGTSFGVSTIFLAAALRDNGGGKVITSEFEPSKVERAQQHMHQAGIADLVEIRAGDALETLSKDIPENIDLLLLDGAKALYPDVLNLLKPHLRPGALVVADDADLCPEYLDYVRSSESGFLSMSFGDDIELSIRLK